MSWIESAPTISPATSEVSSPARSPTPDPPASDAQLSSSCNLARSARARTGTNPADDTVRVIENNRGLVRHEDLRDAHQLVRSGTFSSPILPALRGISRLRHADHTNDTGGSRLSWHSVRHGAPIGEVMRHTPRRAVIEPSMKRSPGERLPGQCHDHDCARTAFHRRLPTRAVVWLSSGCNDCADESQQDSADPVCDAASALAPRGSEPGGQADVAGCGRCHHRDERQAQQ